jgi:hypothetical protein
LARKRRFIPGIYNYCDRWCERCPFTARCRLFADEQKFSRQAQHPSDEDNTAFWQTLDELSVGALECWESEQLDEIEARESRLEELTRREPLVRLSHDYGMDVHRWIQAHEADFPADENRFREARDAITPAEALEVIAWHEFQIGVKLARATHGLFESREEAEEGENWETGNDWVDGDQIDLADIDLQDANGSAKVALLGIERSLGAWTILRDAYPQEDAQIQGFQRQLGRLRHLLLAAFPDVRAFHRPGFDD